MVPGARVVLSQAEHPTAETVSKSDGSYRFGDVPEGTYSVTASVKQLSLPDPLPLQIGKADVKLDLVLRVVIKTEEISVNDASDRPGVSLESASNAGAISIKGEDLKSLADNPEDLQADLQALAGPAAGPSGGSIYIDGFSNGQVPPKESIREVRINQNPFSPEFEKLGLGRVEIFTKPGAAKFNGSVGFNFANDFWNARNPYAAQKAPLLLIESENTVGGPLGKKASFTIDVERHSVDNGSVVNAVILDPSTLQAQQYTSVPKSIQRRLLVTPRVDIQLTENNTLTLRYNFVGSNVRNFGIGQFDLPSRSYKLENRFDTAQIGDSYVAGAWINELRYQFYRWNRSTLPDQNAPTIQVLGAFTAGGTQVGQSSDTQTNHELQDYVSLLHGAHTWRFGVRLRQGIDNSVARASFNGLYTFSSLDAYRITLEGLRSNLSGAAIRALGGGASQLSLTTGIPALHVSQFDAAGFVGDSWRVRPNVLLDLGLRYENQTNIKDNANFSPRIGIAWSPRQHASHSTVVRAGFGIFYDRFALSDVATARRYNGVNQQQYVVMNPDFYPAIPTAAALATAGAAQQIQQQSSRLSAPYLIQSAFTLEQQVTKAATVAVSYTNSRGVHVLRSTDINAPLPGSNIYPYGSPWPVYLMTSSGIYKQNQLIVSTSIKPVSSVSLYSYYVFNRAMSNSDGLTTFPANPYNYAGEYGPAATDIRHRALLGGSLQTRWRIRLSPYLMVQSGSPFDITTGRDLYGTALFNARPSLSQSLGPGIIATPYGFLDPDPEAGQPILGRNAGRGPGSFTFNLRISKTFGFGAVKGSEKAAEGAPKIDATKMSAPGGLRGLFGSSPSEHRYSMIIGLSARNITNHNNPGPIIGTITSPLFGRANQIAGGPNAEGFSESASNRRLELQLRFTF
jgi:hypothetical protein